jgi:hypothetical protein
MKTTRSRRPLPMRTALRVPPRRRKGTSPTTPRSPRWILHKWRTRGHHRRLPPAADAPARQQPRQTTPALPNPLPADSAFARVERTRRPGVVHAAAGPRRLPAGPQLHRRPRAVASLPAQLSLPPPPPPPPPLSTPPPRPASGIAAQPQTRTPTQRHGSTILTRRTTSPPAVATTSRQPSPHSPARRSRPPRPQSRQVRPGSVHPRPARMEDRPPAHRPNPPGWPLPAIGARHQPHPPRPPPHLRLDVPAHLCRTRPQHVAPRACSAQSMKYRSHPSITFAPVRQVSFTRSRRST